MYLLHLWTSTVFQKRVIPSTSSFFVLGFTTHRMYSLSSCQRFSIGFISGDLAGVFHQFIWLVPIQSPAYREVCLGSLSCINLCSVGNVWLMNGIRFFLRSAHTGICSWSSQKCRSLWLLFCLLIPAQLCTFNGCLGLQENKLVSLHVVVTDIYKLLYTHCIIKINSTLYYKN